MINLKNINRFHIVLVGCGGTGSYVFYYLARLMFTELLKPAERRTTLILVDGDTVEEKNLYRQNFIQSDVGKNKAAVLCSRYANAYGIHIEYVDRFVETKTELGALLSYTSRNAYDIVPILIGCVDNYRARRCMHEVFEGCRTEMIYIDAGNGETTGQVVVGVNFNRYWQQNNSYLPPAGAIFQNLLEPEQEKGAEMVSCADLSLRDGQSIMANMATANLVNIALNSIINYRKLPFHIATVDIKTGRVKTVPVKKKS